MFFVVSYDMVIKTTEVVVNYAQLQTRTAMIYLVSINIDSI